MQGMEVRQLVPSFITLAALPSIARATSTLRINSNDRVRKVSATTGIITTVAGNGTQGFSGDGGPATSAELYYPGSIAFDSADNLYISDQFQQSRPQGRRGDGCDYNARGYWPGWLCGRWRRLRPVRRWLVLSASV